MIGGICLQYLRSRGISVGAHLYAVGGIYDTPFDLAGVDFYSLRLLSGRADFPVLSVEAGEAMKAVITDAAHEGDSVGGIIECAAVGLPAGLGEHMFDGIENRISSIVFGIPAVKGIEFGNGFECAHLTGSQNNDPFVTDGKTVKNKTNNCGG
ncbi:MAG: chorismate synthase, partial [Clostridia bacterium]|nr:chorismate synthase [Clostridia bacterium]